jgi:azurin
MKNIRLLAFPIALILASCGGNQPTAEAPTADTTAKTPAASATPGEAKLTIKVIGNSMADMGYEPTSSTVKAGDKVTLTLINTNTMEGMLHNWVLVKLGSGQEVATAAVAAGMDKNYIPENPNVIAASPLAKPNETVSFEFTAPAAGQYNYICTFPGHFPKMVGKLIVE